MSLLATLTPVLAAKKSGGGTFLVSPSVGLMLWTLLAFFITLYVLRKYASPRIGEALDKRQRASTAPTDPPRRTRGEAGPPPSAHRVRLLMSAERLPSGSGTR